MPWLLPWQTFAQSANRITDLNPTTAHTFPEGAFYGKPVHLIPFGDKILFAADDGIHGPELWVSDGTTDGATLLKDIRPGSVGSGISGFTELKGKAYFAANDGITGQELWVTDGTESGTQLLKDLRPGTSGSNPLDLTVAGDLLFCAADLSATEPALWQTDGTEAGTVVTPGLTFSGLGPAQLTALNGKLYFSGPDRELWATDGTVAGTFRVKEISPNSGNSYLEHMVALNGKLYFSADDQPFNSEPWVSDGSEAGTFRLREIEPGTTYGSNPRKFHYFKEKVFFAANGMLWITDGTPDGTDLFKNITVFQASNDISNFLTFGDHLYFPADDGFKGRELWRTDGSPAGTVLVKDINNNFFDSAPEEMTAGANGLFWFRAYTGNGDWELWKSDGTGAGTIRAADLQPGAGGSYPQAFTPWNGALLFVADDGAHGRELWKLDLVTGQNNLLWSGETVSVTPNPANELLHVRFSPVAPAVEYSLRLYNGAGQQVYTAENPAAETAVVPTGQLPPGVYSVVLLSAGDVFTRQVLIHH
ncbi:MAG: T9SS type A sorting domain-containing protein [Lewinellaceae bacterium]|nr:T9SS type A sorting domain-containing protein [Lewinellaceae bacterium]